MEIVPNLILGMTAHVEEYVHPPYIRVMLRADATHNGTGEYIAVVEDPAVIDSLVAQLRQAGDTLQSLQEYGRTMQLPGAGLMYIEPAEAHTPREYETPRAIRQR